MENQARDHGQENLPARQKGNPQTFQSGLRGYRTARTASPRAGRGGQPHTQVLASSCPVLALFRDLGVNLRF